MKAVWLIAGVLIGVVLERGPNALVPYQERFCVTDPSSLAYGACNVVTTYRGWWGWGR
jgi:hypothetical protein